MLWVDDSGLYLAGQRVPPGSYRRAEPPDGRTVTLDRWDVLPASLDGQVAVYVRVGDAPSLVATTSERTKRRAEPD
jgi:hypothetical protein